MNRIKIYIGFIYPVAAAILSLSVFAAGEKASVHQIPGREKVLESMRLANDYFMAKWPNPGAMIDARGRKWPSNIWTRGVYFEGLMELWRVDRSKRLLDYAVTWAESHKWRVAGKQTTRDADNQCCGQTYIELWEIDKRPERIQYIRNNIDNQIANTPDNAWWWIDAMQMSMPVFAKLGVITGDAKYFEKMHALYLDTKNKQGGCGLFNPADGLWWRDRDFVPPYKAPNDEDCYWARGNGWVVLALIRVLDVLPVNHPNRAEYVGMLKTMCEALIKVQRPDGFWNVSLHDPAHFGGKETTGTALFAAGMAWGVRNEILDRKTYLPVIVRAWSAMTADALHANGFLGYVQGTGKEPKDSQPVTYDSKPDFEDYGLGCFLIAGAEIIKLIDAGTPQDMRKK